MSADGRYIGTQYVYRHQLYMPKALAKASVKEPFSGLSLSERSRLLGEYHRARATIRALLLQNHIEMNGE